MKAPSWYPDWRDDALRELMAEQGRLKTSHKLGEWPRFDYDATAGILTFSDASGPRVRANCQVVGTASATSWWWSWANPNWEGCSIGEMQRVRQFGLDNGIEELASDDLLKANDLNHFGWEMTAATARILGAVGAYRAPADNGALAFLVCTSIDFVS